MVRTAGVVILRGSGIWRTIGTPLSFVLLSLKDGDASGSYKIGIVISSHHGDIDMSDIQQLINDLNRLSGYSSPSIVQVNVIIDY